MPATITFGQTLSNSGLNGGWVDGGVPVMTLVGKGISGFADGSGTNALFQLPTGVAVDAGGNIMVADFGNNRIRKVSTNGAVTTLAGSGVAGFADGIGTNARFYNPSGVEVDAAGNVLVADYNNHRIRKVSTNGVVTTLAGSGVAGFADDTNGRSAQFKSPYGVAVDGLGNVYVADQENNRIRKVSTNGAVTTLAGSGRAGFADGIGTNALFNFPYRVAVDAGGNIMVADFKNHRIRKVSTNGAVTTLAGGTTSGYADGSGTNALFDGPAAVAVDAGGNIIVADYNNHRIRKVDTNGEVTTLAGGTTRGYADGPGTNALFNAPIDVAVDAAGNVYVADSWNQRIRKISPESKVSGSWAWATGSITPNAGTTNRYSVVFTPSNTNYFNPVTTNVSLVVNPATPVITNLPTATAITFGQALSNSVLRGGMASVAGSWAWATDSITPNAGTTRYSVVFTPSNTTNFNPVTTNVVLVVNKATPTLSNLPAAAAITFGQALSNSGLSGGGASVAGSWAWQTPTNRLNAGTNSAAVRFTPSDGTNYSAVTTNVSVVVARAVPAITWSNPAAILYGTALSAAQLNARTAVSGLAGNFVYRPVLGTVLPAGTHTLTAVFSTTNANYLSPTTNTVSLRVDLPAPVIRALPVAAPLTFGQALSNSVLSGGLAGRETTVMTLAGGTTSGYADGSGTNALFQSPFGVAVDSSGSLVVADTYNHRIRKVSPGGDVTTLAGDGTIGSADNTNGVSAQFNFPFGVAVDAAGNVYVADSINHRIRKVETNGAVTTLAGSGEVGFSGGGFADGPGTNAQFKNPYGVAVDAAGNVLVADYVNNRIRMVDTNGVVTTLAGGTTSGYADGPGTNALFNAPAAVAVDAAGNVYVADQQNHRIRKMDINGAVTTLAGGTTNGYADGPGTNALFNSPLGVAVDSAGNVYVADQQNHRIRKVDTNGAVTTLAGSSSGFTNGSGTNARFNFPRGVAVDGSGNVFVADQGNHRIRMIVPERQVSGTWSWTTPGQVPDAGVRTSSVTFTPTDLVNFRVLTSNVTVTVAKATPVISDLPTAAPITFGQALSNSVLGGGSNGVAGRWGWETPTNRPAVGTNAFNVIFTPSNPANFNAVTTNVSLVVNPARPVLSNLPTAGAITFGQALSNSVLSGGSNSVAGSWAWATGSITPSASLTNRYSVVFTPSNTANFSPVTTNLVLVVNKAVPSITWSNPEAITFGSALSGTQLNATNPVAGTYSYLPTNGTVLNAGSNNLVLTFRATDSNNYVSPVTRTNPLVVNRATPVISNLPTAAAIAFGQALSNSVLGGGSNGVAGSWAWQTPTNRPAVGTNAFNVIFTPSNPANFNAVTTNVSLVVNPARPVLSNLPTAGAITFGQALSNSVLSGGSNSVAGSWAWATGSITPNAGTNRYSVVFTPSNTANFSPVTTNLVLVVNKAVPQISWSPAAITVGSALSSAQLNATSPVAGLFMYSPSIGTLMPRVGATNLRVVFTTTNSNYVSPVTNTVSLTVNPVVLANSAPVASGAATLAAIPGGVEIYVLRGDRVGNLFLNNFSDAADVTRTNGLLVVRGDWTYPGKTAGNLRNGDTIGSAFAAWKANGSVVTWGDTNFGGNSSVVSSSLSNGVVEIFSAGSAFAALRTNGAVVTWGGANFGGNSSAVSNSLAGGVAGVFSTRSAFAALKTNGAVVTWGATDFGGDSSGVSSLASGVAVIFSTDSAFAALKTNGSVVAWGDSSAGGDLGFSGDGLTNGVVRIYATAAAFAALKGDGSVVSWGAGDSGGDSGNANLGEGVVEIFSARSAFAALKTNGAVVTWGSPNQGGEPSVVPPGGMGDPISVAESLTSGVAEIFSTDTAFAALKEDGSVVTWGSGSDGGDSSTIAESLTSGVAEIFATKTAFAALKEDGSVVTWGQGNGGDSSAVAENLVEGVITVVAADYAFAALKTNGSVVTWGATDFGGDSSGVSNSLTGGVREIFSAAGGFAALKTDGSVVTWGDSNSFGGGGFVNSNLASGVLTVATPAQRSRLVRGDALAGVAVVSNAATVGQGAWQYSSGGGIWSNVPTNLSASSALVLQNSTRLCFAPATNFTGTPGALTVRLIETGEAPLVSGSTTNTVTFSGGTNRISTNSVQLSTQVR